jgi:hypothetical protein
MPILQSKFLIPGQGDKHYMLVRHPRSSRSLPKVQLANKVPQNKHIFGAKYEVKLQSEDSIQDNDLAIRVKSTEELKRSNVVRHRETVRAGPSQPVIITSVTSSETQLEENKARQGRARAKTVSELTKRASMPLNIMKPFLQADPIPAVSVAQAVKRPQAVVKLDDSTLVQGQGFTLTLSGTGISQGMKVQMADSITMKNRHRSGTVGMVPPNFSRDPNFLPASQLIRSDKIVQVTENLGSAVMRDRIKPGEELTPAAHQVSSFGVGQAVVSTAADSVAEKILPLPADSANLSKSPDLTEQKLGYPTAIEKVLINPKIFKSTSAQPIELKECISPEDDYFQPSLTNTKLNHIRAATVDSGPLMKSGESLTSQSQKRNTSSNSIREGFASLRVSQPIDRTPSIPKRLEDNSFTLETGPSRRNHSLSILREGVASIIVDDNAPATRVPSVPKKFDDNSFTLEMVPGGSSSSLKSKLKSNGTIFKGMDPLKVDSTKTSSKNLTTQVNDSTEMIMPTSSDLPKTAIMDEKARFSWDIPDCKFKTAESN